MPGLKKAVAPAPHIAPLRPQKNSDPTVKTFRALTPLRVGDANGTTTHMRYFGDFVPEAEGWRNLPTYLNTKQIEIAFVNQSEIDAWREMYEERIAIEDAEKAAQQSIDDEIAELRARERELLAKKKAAEGNSVNPEPSAAFNEDTRVEKIDFGSVKNDGTGQLHRAAVPTREVPVQKNVGETRTRPNKVLKKG